MWRNRLSDHCPVRDALDDPLCGAFGETDPIICAEMELQKPLGSGGERYDPSLALASVPSALAPNDKPILLPMDLLAPQAAEFANAESCIEHHPDDQLLLE